MPGPEGVATPSLHASYLHTHWAGHPHLARRFVEAARRHRGPDLRHHGDKDAGPGLVDLAVNVFDGPRPTWLDRALVASVTDADAYPDASEAEARGRAAPRTGTPATCSPPPAPPRPSP